MLCRCGCGQEIKSGRSYVHGHNRPWLGKTRPDLAGEANPMHRSEIAEKLGSLLRDRPLSMEHRNLLAQRKRGLRRSQETCQRISEGLVRAHARGDFENISYENMSGATYYQGRWYRSPGEVAVVRELTELGVDVQYEPKTFDFGDCTYRPDFYLPDLNIWIEVKGWMDEISEQKIARFWFYQDEMLYVLLEAEGCILKQLMEVL